MALSTRTKHKTKGGNIETRAEKTAYFALLFKFDYYYLFSSGF